MVALTHCPKCTYSLSPHDTKCPRCGLIIARQTTSGTVRMTRPVNAYLEHTMAGLGVPQRFALQSHILTYTIGRSIGTPTSSQLQDRIFVDARATAVAANHARLQIDLRDPSVPIYRIEDLNSPNGLFRNNQRIHQSVLDDGDELWLGPVNGQTSVRIIYHDPVDKPPLKRFLLSPTGHNPVQIGREVGLGHLKLFSESASDNHALITKVPAGQTMRYELSDARSKNGTFINNVPLVMNQRQALNAGDQVRFADCQYVAQRLDPLRMVLQPLGAQAIEHIAGTNITRSVNIDSNVWLGEYLRYLWRKVTRATSRPSASGTALVPPQRVKTLLHDVDIVIGPNDFVILVGSSGSGKTTLMHVLSTFIYPQQGALSYKGQPYKDNPGVLRPQIGYVPQDDIIHEQLTVYQELKYAADLRLPATFTAEERERRIHSVLKQLRPIPQARQRIAKLSGGQRKRVSIAVELLNKPGILFLDEPTEGQDLALEQSIIVLLRGLSNEGTSVILVSHRLNFLDYVDYVGWLAPGGFMSYFGPPDQVARYFGINPNFTPARQYAAIYDKLDRDPNPAHVAHNFKGSGQYQEFVKARQQPPKQQTPMVMPGGKSKSPVPLPFSAGAGEQRRQLPTLFKRDWAVVMADWSFLLWMIVQAPLIGLLLNILTDPNMFQLGVSDPALVGSPNVLPAQKIIFPLSVSAVWLGVFTAMRELVKERSIYRRERMVGLRLAPYLTSKIAVLSTFSVYQSIVLVWLVLAKADDPATGVFLPTAIEMFITVLLTSFGGMSLGLLLSALARTQEVVGALVPLAVIPQFMLNKALGFSLTGVMDWLAHLMFTHWSVEALGDTVGLEQSASGPMGETRLEYRPEFGHLVGHWLVLLAISGVLLTFTWIRQKRRDRYQG